MWAGSQMTMQYGTNVNYEMLRTAPRPPDHVAFGAAATDRLGELRHFGRETYGGSGRKERVVS